MSDSDERHRSNRERKLAGKDKRRRFVQGRRNYLHALTNAVSNRAKRATRTEAAKHDADDEATR